ncbi:hypothetical protein DPV78_012708 [Talaromyces pinophilus]|nr:hypothetical protein DPV78_012708 [Talaromyces pinophilus]
MVVIALAVLCGSWEQIIENTWWRVNHNFMMGNNDILERFRTFDLPKLWIVTYPWWQASYARNRDLIASNTTLKLQTEAELKQALNHSYIFQAKHVTSELRILYSRSLEHEYFILHCIPHNAIKSRILLRETEERDANIQYKRQCPFNPYLYWIDNLHGYYDTNKECEMHNINDNIMNLLKGDD